jgi:putative ABC transport system permease protein
MVEAERVSIGIMRALGYSKSAIVGHYTRYALLIGLLGSVPGVIAGYLFTLLMLPFFSMFFRVPGITALHVWQLYPFSIALACVPCALAGFLAGSKATKIIPSEAMRPAAPDVGRRVLFENLHALWSRIGTTTKMVFRGVSRNFRRFVFASLGIAFTFGLILVPIHSVFLFDMLIAKQYGELELYDYSVALASPQDRSVVREVARLSGASHAEPYAEEPLRLSHGWREESVLARAVLPDSSLFLFEADDGTKVSVPDRGILISEFIALQLGVERGSVIAVVSPRDPDTKHYIAVEDVVRQYLGTGAYVSLGQMERILGTKNVINGVALKTEGQVSADLDSAPGVLAVYNATALINAYNELMEMGTYSLSMMVFFGCALGFAVLFTTSSISLSERLREFATMRVLGFHRREILAMVAKENFAALVSGVLLGIPLGYGLCIGIARTFSSEMYFLPEDVLPLPYFVCGGITVVFFGLVMMALWRRISRLQFMDALKTRIT